MQPHKLLIGAAIFAAFVIGGMFILSSLMNDYDEVDLPVVNTKEMDALESTVDSLYNESIVGKEDLQTGEVDTEVEVPLISGIWNVLNGLWNFTTAFGQIIGNAMAILSIPGWFKPIIVVIMLILVGWTILYLARGFQPR